MLVHTFSIGTSIDGNVIFEGWDSTISDGAMERSTVGALCKKSSVSCWEFSGSGSTCVLISSIYELGLEPIFWTSDTKEAVVPKVLENWDF